MALGKSRVRMNAKAKGILLKATEIASGGSAVTMDDLGYLENVQIGDENGMIDFMDAAGDMINQLQGSRKITITANMLQTGTDEIALLNTAANKFFHVYIQVQLDNPTVYYQEWYFPVCKIVPGANLNFRAAERRVLPITIVALMPKAAITVAPAGLSVSAGSLFAFAETATTALGQITTSSGTVYTTVV